MEPAWQSKRPSAWPKSFAHMAGEQLGLSRRVVSHIVGISEVLGLAAGERTTRSVAPTAAGERLLERLRPALDEYQAALESTNEFRQSGGMPCASAVIVASRRSSSSIVETDPMRGIIFPDMACSLAGLIRKQGLRTWRAAGDRRCADIGIGHRPLAHRLDRRAAPIAGPPGKTMGFPGRRAMHNPRSASSSRPAGPFSAGDRAQRRQIRRANANCRLAVPPCPNPASELYQQATSHVGKMGRA